MFLKLLLTIIGAAILSGCGLAGRVITQGTHRPYHLHNPVYRCSGFTMGHLEFDDQGEPWAKYKGIEPGKSQLKAVSDAIQAESRKRPQRVVVYIHGWNNNGQGPNLGKFKETLEKMSSADPGMGVFGVYVSWRGKVFPGSSLVDVTNREAAAARIGGGPLFSALREISQNARKNPRNRITFIGHSYGAKMLASVMSNYVATLDPGIKKPIADVIILANTAENGIVARQMINTLKERTIDYKHPRSGRPLPLIVVLGSDKDRGVKWALPVWNFIARDLTLLAFPQKSGQTSSWEQHWAIYKGMGFVGSIRSHEFGESPDTSGEEKMAKANTVKDAWKRVMVTNHFNGQQWGQSRKGDLKLTFYPDAKHEKFGNPRSYLMKRQGEGAGEVPFWVAKVPGFVIKDHGDIWNMNFYGLLSALEGMKADPPPGPSSRPGPASPPRSRRVPDELPPPTEMKPLLRIQGVVR